jgi:biopolymer transport protein ExbB/TolQ
MKDIKAIIKSLVVKTLLKLGGFQAWVANIVFNVIWKKIQKLLKQYQTKNQANKEVNGAFNKYKEVVENPSSSADDIRNSFDDLNRS